MASIETVFGSGVRMDKPSIDLSYEMMGKYNELGNHYADHTIYDNNEPTGLLIGKFSGETINGELIFKLTWGYSMEEHKENAIPLEELKTINFMGNLHTMLDENYSTPIIQLLFALFGTIIKHYNKHAIGKPIKNSSNDNDIADDELIYLSI